MKHHKVSVPGRILRWGNWRIALLPAIFLGIGVCTACEDKSLGRPCDVMVPTSPTQGVYAVPAADCPTRMCVKPAIQFGVSTDLDTGPYCSTLCTSDNDCNGQTRDSNNPNDRRCKKGFTCAVAFGSGQLVQPEAGPQSLCCAKICLCKDFYSPAYGPTVPEECKPGADASCP